MCEVEVAVDDNGAEVAGEVDAVFAGVETRLLDDAVGDVLEFGILEDLLDLVDEDALERRGAHKVDEGRGGVHVDDELDATIAVGPRSRGCGCRSASSARTSRRSAGSGVGTSSVACRSASARTLRCACIGGTASFAARLLGLGVSDSGLGRLLAGGRLARGRLARGHGVRVPFVWSVAM